MPVSFDREQGVFHLRGKGVSYVMGIERGAYLTHLYWGAGLNSYRGTRKIIWKDRGFAPNPLPEDRSFSLDTLPQEYPQTGNGDFRTCAYGVRDAHGCRVSNLTYQSHEVVLGKPALPGLPASFAADGEAETLAITLADEVSGLRARLLYTVFADANIITRSVRFENRSDAPITLTKMLSMSVDIREAGFDVLTLYGAHNNERNMDRRRLTSGSIQIESMRGVSSPQQAPFMALLRPETTEDTGEVFAANFVYSGNFVATAQADAYGNTRFQMGMNPQNGEWLLAPGESFQTPEVVMAYSSRGLNGMSQMFHRFYQNHLIRSEFACKPRPVLLNSWEGSFYDFDEEKLLALARKGAGAGIELFVLDDGWFGHRDADDSSLGDWFVDERKLPHGLAWLSERVHDLGMQFGLWVEPEMISQDSELFREHPDWALHAEGRPYTVGRGQLVLDLSRPEICDHVIESMARVLESARIEYVKWDMNRHLTEVQSGAWPSERQGEIFHRYVLGLYRIVDELTSRFPNVLFESCSSGGGRFDPGMLYYMPQTWASDNTDALCRMKIQYATSLTYPPITMGAHVSASPNQQTGRLVSLSTRAAVAMSANFGYELDLTACTDEELAAVREQVAFYKEIRDTIQFGAFHRVSSPFEGNLCQWNFVSPDGSEVVAFHFELLSQPGAPVRLLKLKGLDADACYRDVATGEIYGGDELMYSGLSIPLKKQDFRSECFRFVKVEREG